MYIRVLFITLRGKVHPTAGCEIPEGEQSYSSVSVDGCGWSAQRHDPAALPPGKDTRYTLDGGWMDSMLGQDRRGKSRPHRDSFTVPSRLQHMAVQTTAPGATGSTLQSHCKSRDGRLCQRHDTVYCINTLTRLIFDTKHLLLLLLLLFMNVSCHRHFFPVLLLNQQ